MSSSRSPSPWQKTAEETATGFTNIDTMMSAARAKYASKPHLVPNVELQPYAPTAEDADSNERVGIAVSKARGMIAEGKSQLAAPCIAPEQFIPEELDDQAEWRKWDDGLRMATECNDRWLADNQTLFEDVMDSIREPDDDWDLLLNDVQVPGDPMLRCLEALERISAGAKCWVAISKARSREHMIRDAPLKPVLVVKPAQGSVENGRNEEGGAARRGGRNGVLRDVRKRGKAGETFVSRQRNCNRALFAANEDEKYLAGADPASKPLEVDVAEAGDRNPQSSVQSTWHTLVDWDSVCTWQ